MGRQGCVYVARLMNKVYIRDRITKFEIWCPIDSIYDQIIWGDTGAMQADTPWCGHYTVWPAVWAVAHTTQFAEPGWVYIDQACGQLDPQTWRGSHVALRDPNSGDWSLIVVTGQGKKIRLEIGAGLKAGPVHVWKSTSVNQFVEQRPVPLQAGGLELQLDADAIYTFTSTTGQHKGAHPAPPPRKPFPLPFAEDFEKYRPGDTPRYFSDQKGTFEVCRRPDGGLCLAQIVPAKASSGSTTGCSSRTPSSATRNGGCCDRGRRMACGRRCRDRRTLRRPQQTRLPLGPCPRRPLAIELAIHARWLPDRSRISIRLPGTTCV